MPLTRPLNLRLIALALVLALSWQSISCGTLLYPHRQGQRGTQADPAVVIMDGALLLLFIVPGVIAFVVDYSTGAIYLGPGEKPFTTEMKPLLLPPSKLTRAELERIIFEQTGKRIELKDTLAYRVKGGDIRALERDLTEKQALSMELLTPVYAPAALDTMRLASAK